MINVTAYYCFGQKTVVSADETDCNGKLASTRSDCVGNIEEYGEAVELNYEKSSPTYGEAAQTGSQIDPKVMSSGLRSS